MTRVYISELFSRLFNNKKKLTQVPKILQKRADRPDPKGSDEYGKKKESDGWCSRNSCYFNKPLNAHHQKEYSS
jgi:hypothetical protein